MQRITNILNNLAKSKFRSSFKLDNADAEYIKEKGLRKIESHARDLITKRLAPSSPHNDGQQTPFKGHPAFKAQHATATCCRKCLMKWHRIPNNRTLTEREIGFIIELITQWISKGYSKDG